MLAVLRAVEPRYQREVVVVGVHAGKFPAERVLGNLRQAARRLRVEHPIVNDGDYRIWQRYDVHAWPTLVFLDPQGMVVGKYEGELPAEALDRLLDDMVRAFDAQGLLRREPIEAVVGLEVVETGPLAFPGKVLVDETSNRLFVADSGHHRVVVAGLDGRVQQVVGSGQPGWVDGDLAACQFDNPQGMALVDGALFVADAENHLVRRVDLVAGRVETVAGTGLQAPIRTRRGPARQTPLNSPWDLARWGRSLFIAMAGLHQIWRLDLDAGAVEAFAGTGHEGIRDRRREAAWLAQPMGLAVDGDRLYFVDSESSAVRWVDLGADGEVHTIVGTGLFDFGDVDGVGEAALLQHPQGSTVADGVVYVADSYNQKIKRVDPRTRQARTLAGTGQPGRQDGPASRAAFHEPGGVSAARGRLYVADTNNHAVRVVDLLRGEVSTLELRW